MKRSLKLKNTLALAIMYYRHPAVTYLFNKKKKDLWKLDYRVRIGDIKIIDNIGYGPGSKLFQNSPLPIWTGVQLYKLGYPIDLFKQDKLSR